MVIPKTITHLGITYQVIIDSEEFKGDNSNSLGFTDFDNTTICIRDNLTTDKLCETFFHELLHVAYETAGLKNIITSNTDKDLLEEGFVNVLSQQLYGLLKVNNLLLWEHQKI